MKARTRIEQPIAVPGSRICQLSFQCTSNYRRGLDPKADGLSSYFLALLDTFLRCRVAWQATLEASKGREQREGFRGAEDCLAHGARARRPAGSAPIEAADALRTGKWLTHPLDTEQRICTIGGFLPQLRSAVRMVASR